MSNRIVELAWSFPVLRPCMKRLEIGEDWGRPWDPKAFDACVAEGGGSGAICAAAFVLNIWNSGHDWKCGAFNLGRAIGTWDQWQREAFQEWATEPWLA